jgi:hypothetical protein
MPNPWLTEHKSTAAMNYFLNSSVILCIKAVIKSVIITLCLVKLIIWQYFNITWIRNNRIKKKKIYCNYADESRQQKSASM